MGTENALATVEPEMDVMRLGKILYQSGYFTDAKSEAQAIVKVLAGRELGFGPLASMSGIHIVQGKPVLSAHLMAAAVKRSGRYNYRVKALTDNGCTVAFYESGEPVGESTFTMEDAKRAGLAGRDTWKAYPRNMLFARAMSNGVGVYCPDLLGGGPVYTPEEMGAQVVDFTTGEILDEPAPAELPAPADLTPDELWAQWKAAGHTGEELAAILALPGGEKITPKVLRAYQDDGNSLADLLETALEVEDAKEPELPFE